MLRRLYAWLDGWRETLTIKYRHPDLYHELTNAGMFDDDDYVEVGPPE